MVTKIATTDCGLSDRYLTCVTGENTNDVRKVTTSFPQIYLSERKRIEVERNGEEGRKISTHIGGETVWESLRELRGTEGKERKNLSRCLGVSER